MTMSVSASVAPYSLAAPVTRLQDRKDHAANPGRPQETTRSLREMETENRSYGRGRDPGTREAKP